MDRRASRASPAHVSSMDLVTPAIARRSAGSSALIKFTDAYGDGAVDD